MVGTFQIIVSLSNFCISTMSHSVHGGYSPVRAKRRQSDAKWRASVSTCYDALKYVVPNVKHMSKKKISKALILQECEKHIQDLESTISYLLHVERKSKGKVVLWKEDSQWSPCTMENLRSDFSDKQRGVFPVSARGRRCYSLLQDIKEEVFSLRADPKRLAVIDEAQHQQLLTRSSSVPHSDSSSSPLSVILFQLQDTDKPAPSESGSSSRNQDHSQETRDQSRPDDDDAAASVARAKPGKSISKLPYNCTVQHGQLQVRKQQSHPHQKLLLEDHNMRDTAHLIQAASHSRQKLFSQNQDVRDTVHPLQANISVSMRDATNLLQTASHPHQKVFPQEVQDTAPPPLSAAYSSSYSVSDQQQSHSTFLCESREKHQIVPCLSSTQSPLPSSMLSSVSVLPRNLPAGEQSEVTYNMWGERASHVVPQRVSVCSNHHGYTYLLRSLDTEQEVPCLENVPRIKRPRLTSTDTDCQHETSNSGAYCSNNIAATSYYTTSLLDNSTARTVDSNNRGRAADSTMDSNADSGTMDSSAESTSKNMHCGFMESLSSRIVTSSSGSFASPRSLSVSDVKMVTQDTGDYYIDYDPLLSSLGTSKPELNVSTLFEAENDTSLKLPHKLGSAQKKLNLNYSQPVYGWTSSSSCFSSPNKAAAAAATQHSPGPVSFTPVKLPDTITFNYEPADNLTSPWKSLNSPFNCRLVPQGGCMDSGCMSGLEDTLLCLETIDASDLEDSLDTTQKPYLTETESKVKLKCRKSLERLYDQPAAPAKQDVIPQAQDNHVVPQVDVGYWTPDSPPPHLEVYLSHNTAPAADLENTFLCLEDIHASSISTGATGLC